MATTVRAEATALGDANGAAMASVLAAGIGSFAMGFFVILNEAGLFVAPALYGPAGGVTGRTTFAVFTWLVAWGVLHARWKARDVASARVLGVTLLLVAAGVLGTFPPIWAFL